MELLFTGRWESSISELSFFTVAMFWAALPWLKRDSRRARTIAYWIYTALLLRYCLWRGYRTMSVADLSLTMMFCYAYISFELYTSYVSARSFKGWTDFTDRSREADEHAGWYRSAHRPPVVDFLIPSYNESFAVLERAIIGGLSQTYSNVRVWVLDDGRREWLRELAASKGVNYLTRDNNAGFKAGNLNHALAHISSLAEPSQFFAVLDCDFIATPRFVERTMSLMYDETVAIVQTKQLYFNPDPFQYALPVGRALPDWQRGTFDFSAACADARGDQTCCGTCFLGRTSSFNLIGGVPTESVAEDRLSTYALNTYGLRTIYLNEGHSYGLVAEGLREFLTQCGRWCLGVVQNIHSRWGGAAPGKTWRQRLRFVESSTFWGISCVSKLLQLWLPILYWFLGPSAFPIRGSDGQYLAYFAPFWTFSLVAQFWLTRGTAALPILSDARALLQAPVVLLATYRGLINSKDTRFVVTDKGMLRDRTIVHWHSLKWLLLVGVLTAAGLIYSMFDPFATSRADRFDGFAYFWSYYNLLGIVTAAAVCIEPAQRRDEQRFGTDEVAEVELDGVELQLHARDISVGGVRLHPDARLRAGDSVRLRLADVAWVPGRVVRSQPTGVAIQFDAGPVEREQLIRKLFTPNYIKPVMTGKPWGMYRGVLAKAFG